MTMTWSTRKPQSQTIVHLTVPHPLLLVTVLLQPLYLTATVRQHRLLLQPLPCRIQSARRAAAGMPQTLPTVLSWRVMRNVGRAGVASVRTAVAPGHAADPDHDPGHGGRIPGRGTDRDPGTGVLDPDPGLEGGATGRGRVSGR